MADEKTPNVGDTVIIPPVDEDDETTGGEKKILEVGDYDDVNETWSVKVEGDDWLWIYWDESDEVWTELQ